MSLDPVEDHEAKPQVDRNDVDYKRHPRRRIAPQKCTQFDANVVKSSQGGFGLAGKARLIDSRHINSNLPPSIPGSRRYRRLEIPVLVAFSLQLDAQRLFFRHEKSWSFIWKNILIGILCLASPDFELLAVWTFRVTFDFLTRHSLFSYFPISG